MTTDECSRWEGEGAVGARTILCAGLRRFRVAASVLEFKKGVGFYQRVLWKGWRFHGGARMLRFSVRAQITTLSAELNLNKSLAAH